MDKEEILWIANQMEDMGHQKVAYVICRQMEEISRLQSSLNRAISHIESLNKSLNIARRTI